jgi:quinol monooxygenase YgiN
MNKIRRDDSIVNVTRITVTPEHRRELFQTISSLLDPLKKDKGCLAYRVYKDADDENTFVLIGEWETPGAWYDYLNSNNFAVLLGSISLLCAPSPIDFKLLSHAAGVEELTMARIHSHP